MLYRTQQDFERFKCIADRCPKSCCIGWQIVIDDSSIEKYQNTRGDFANRLQSSIDFDELCFIQNHHRCSMLNDNGLCDLHSTLGEDYLCDTCRLYPRHTEEFLDIREYSLSLSCPEVVRMLLEPDYDFKITESQDDSFDDEDEFEDFDFLIFDKLAYARDKMFEVTSDRSLDLQARMRIIAEAAYKLQVLFDEGEIFEMDSVIDCMMQHQDSEIHTDSSNASLSFDYLTDSLDVLLDMEVLEESWRDSIRSCQNFWKDKNRSSDEWHAVMYPSDNLEYVFEKVLKSLLFSYFCGAIYDGQIYARTMIAVQSVRWLMMLYYTSGEDSPASTIYLYSREVEHSDININSLISFFEEDL